MDAKEIIRLANECGVGDKDLSDDDSVVTDYGNATFEVLRFAAAIAKAEREAMDMDAARYRWLRAQHWSDNTIAAVRWPRDAIKPSYDAPSGERLDAMIDEAMVVGAGTIQQQAKGDVGVAGHPNHQRTPSISLQAVSHTRYCAHSSPTRTSNTRGGSCPPARTLPALPASWLRTAPQ